MPVEATRLTHRYAAVNGIRLHIVEIGDGQPIVLLHGFPEFWYSWRHQLTALSEAVYRTIAPDLRGYNESSLPADVASYRTKALVADIAHLIVELQCGPACVVGHDWGGLIAWRLAATRPNLVRKLAILNAPHPTAFRKELMRNWRQWIKSSYVLFFQLPWLPERALRAMNSAVLRRAWRTQPKNPDAFTDADIRQYLQAIAKSGLQGPLGYYRAGLRYPADLFEEPQKITVPTLVIWGRHDPFISLTVNDHLTNLVPNLHIEAISEASHWVQNEASSQVNTLLADFFGRDQCDVPVEDRSRHNAL